MSKMSRADIEANIRAAKLREAQRIKNQLEQKLKFVESNIGTIQGTTTKPANKLNLMDE